MPLIRSYRCPHVTAWFGYQRLGQSSPSNPEKPSKPNGKRNSNEGCVQPGRARIRLFWMPENL